MAEFASNNVKNASTGHTSFEVNYGYHPRISYEEELIFAPSQSQKTNY